MHKNCTETIQYRTCVKFNDRQKKGKLCVICRDSPEMEDNDEQMDQQVFDRCQLHSQLKK